MTSAHFTLKSVPGKTPSNCTTLLTYNPKAVPTSGTSTTTWNTGKTSTVAFKLLTIKGKPTASDLQRLGHCRPVQGHEDHGDVRVHRRAEDRLHLDPLGKVSVANTGPLVVK